MSEFYSEFLFRYQTDAAPRKVSINVYSISEGVEYRNFIKWYRDNKKRLRNDNGRLLFKQREGNRQILEKLDKALDELKSMRKDNKSLSNQLSKALEAKTRAKQQSELISGALVL